MKAFFRQHSKTSSITSQITDQTHRPSVPVTPTEWWLARENAFDTAARVYKKLYRPDSDTSFYSREQDYDECEDEEVSLLSPSSPEWNASRWFWSEDRAQMWVEHVGSSGCSACDMHEGDGQVSLDARAMTVSVPEARSGAAGDTVNTADDSQGEREELQDCQDSRAEVKSIAELPRRPKLTIHIPSGTPDYYAKHGPNDYSSCRPHITSEERVEWRQNMF
jgi:hypothetical protein